MSMDPCTGVSQTTKTYWQRIEDEYFQLMAKYPNRTAQTFRSLQGKNCPTTVQRHGCFRRNIFKLEQRWELLKNCDKWALIDRESPPKKGSLMEMDEDEDGDGPRNLNRPDGDKKTKEKIKREREASTLRDKIDSMLHSNKVLLAKSLDAKIELVMKKAREKQERWKLLKEVKEKKARAAENKTMANLLAEENMIKTLNRNNMDISKE
ncbi:hypothetical protein D1007_47822 [Hordeum vulgare]|nr:hypothetical protein D1007_47822 [Hordeum vulgare]